MGRVTLLLAITIATAAGLLLGRLTYVKNEEGTVSANRAMDETLDTASDGSDLNLDSYTEAVEEGIVSTAIPAAGFLAFAIMSLVSGVLLVNLSHQDENLELLGVLWLQCTVLIIGGAYFGIRFADKAMDARLDAIVAYARLDGNALRSAADYYDTYRANRIAGGLAAGWGGTLLLVTSGWFARKAKAESEESVYAAAEQSVRRVPIQVPPRLVETPVQVRPGTSLLYQVVPDGIPQPPTIDQILSEAQRVYKEGNLDLAIFILETTDDPRAQKVLARLRGMKQ